MSKYVTLALLALSTMLVGCGKAPERAPDASNAVKEVPNAAAKGMEESFKHMPPEMQQKMKAQFENSKPK